MCIRDSATGGAIQQQNSSSREYVVDLTLTDEGKTKFAEAAVKYLPKQLFFHSITIRKVSLDALITIHSQIP